MKQLPDKLYKLIELAYTDALKALANPTYVLNMNVWHETKEGSGTCQVCLAGAVIAGTLGASPNLGGSPALYGDATMGKLYAINEVRKLNFVRALDEFYRDDLGSVLTQAAEVSVSLLEGGTSILYGRVSREQLIKFFESDAIVKYIALLKQYDL